MATWFSEHKTVVDVWENAFFSIEASHACDYSMSISLSLLCVSSSLMLLPLSLLSLIVVHIFVSGLCHCRFVRCLRCL